MSAFQLMAKHKGESVPLTRVTLCNNIANGPGFVFLLTQVDTIFGPCDSYTVPYLSSKH